MVSETIATCGSHIAASTLPARQPAHAALFNHANHAGCPRIGRHFRHGVEVILRVQIGNLLLAANQVNLTVAPVAAVFSGEDVGVHRLVRTVKCAKPK
jgi:hypothetical protein